MQNALCKPSYMIRMQCTNVVQTCKLTFEFLRSQITKISYNQQNNRLLHSNIRKMFESHTQKLYSRYFHSLHLSIRAINESSNVLHNISPASINVQLQRSLRFRSRIYTPTGDIEASERESEKKFGILVALVSLIRQQSFLPYIIHPRVRVHIFQCV